MFYFNKPFLFLTAWISGFQSKLYQDCAGPVPPWVALCCHVELGTPRGICRHVNGTGMALNERA